MNDNVKNIYFDFMILSKLNLDLGSYSNLVHITVLIVLTQEFENLINKQRDFCEPSLLIFPTKDAETEK